MKNKLQFILLIIILLWLISCIPKASEQVMNLTIERIGLTTWCFRADYKMELYCEQYKEYLNHRMILGSLQYKIFIITQQGICIPLKQQLNIIYRIVIAARYRSISKIYYEFEIRNNQFRKLTKEN